jgi:hypothetical protein
VLSANSAKQSKCEIPRFARNDRERDCFVVELILKRSRRAGPRQRHRVESPAYPHLGKRFWGQFLTLYRFWKKGTHLFIKFKDKGSTKNQNFLKEGFKNEKVYLFRDVF